MLDSGKIQISDLEKITNQSWEKLLDRSVHQSGGEIFGGGVNGMIRKIGYELIRFVELEKFSVGCQQHGIIAAILVVSRKISSVMGHTAMTEKNIFKFFEPGIRKFTIMDKVRKLHKLIANKMINNVPYNPHDYFKKLEFINNEMESEQNRQNFGHQESLFDTHIPTIHLRPKKPWKSEPLDFSIFDGDSLGNYIKAEFLLPPPIELNMSSLEKQQIPNNPNNPNNILNDPNDIKKKTKRQLPLTTIIPEQRIKLKVRLKKPQIKLRN